MGRPSLLTSESRGALIGALEKGLTVAAAARCAGVSRRTVYDWFRRGDSGEEPYAGLLLSAQEARAKSLLGLLERAHLQSIEDPSMTRWLITRMEPGQFGDKAEPVDMVRESWGELTEGEAAELMAKVPAIREAVLKAERERALPEEGGGDGTRTDASE